MSGRSSRYFGQENLNRGFGEENIGKGLGQNSSMRGFGMENNTRGFSKENNSRSFGQENNTMGFGQDNMARGFGKENTASSYPTLTSLLSGPCRAVGCKDRPCKECSEKTKNQGCTGKWQQSDDKENVPPARPFLGHRFN